jgi:hypothetical protein
MNTFIWSGPLWVDGCADGAVVESDEGFLDVFDGTYKSEMSLLDQARIGMAGRLVTGIGMDVNRSCRQPRTSLRTIIHPAMADRMGLVVGKGPEVGDSERSSEGQGEVVSDSVARRLDI